MCSACHEPKTPMGGILRLFLNFKYKIPPTIIKSPKTKAPIATPLMPIPPPSETGTELSVGVGSSVGSGVTLAIGEGVKIGVVVGFAVGLGVKVLTGVEVGVAVVVGHVQLV